MTTWPEVRWNWSANGATAASIAPALITASSAAETAAAATARITVNSMRRPTPAALEPLLICKLVLAIAFGIVHWALLRYRQGGHVDASDTFDPELWYLAWEDERLVGVLLASAESEEDPELGYVGWLGVIREARGRGIGEALLRGSFARFYELGKGGAQLVVDSESSTGADRLYERVGMTPQPRFANWDRPLNPPG